MTRSTHDTNKPSHPEKWWNVMHPRRWVTHSLNAKFLLIILSSVAITTLIFMIYFGYKTRQTLRNNLNQEVQVFAKSFSDTVDDLMWNYQTKELGSALAAIANTQNILRVEIYTMDGKLFLASGVSAKQIEGNQTSIHQPIFHLQPSGDRFNLGELILHYSYDNADKLFRAQTIRGSIRLLLIAAVIAVSAIFAYRRTIGAPLAKFLTAIHITDDSGKMTRVDWDSDDEIGQVISAHNVLIKHLAKKENDLSDSERRYRQLFDNAPVGIFKTRPDGTVKDANQTSADIMGFSTIKEFKAENVVNRYVDQEERNRLWELLEKKGEVSNFKARLQRMDGTIIWVELSGKLDPDYSLNGIMVDISSRVEAEKIIKDRDELHRGFFEENKAVMLLHDPKDSSIHFANPAACLYYGYSNEELVSMKTSDLNCMTDADIFAEMQQASVERQTYFNFVHTMKDHSQRDVEVYTGPISLGERQLHYSIVHDVTERRRLERKLERMATTDQLTGALNRHAFFSRAKDELARSHRYGHPLAMLMLDLDHFKQVNDTYGHAAGDDVLRAFALSCRAELRDTDIFGRLGGEEFAAILVETNEEQALMVAQRLRTITKSTSVPADEGITISITTSIGVTMLQETDDVATLLKRADMGLYDAKETGRNKVIKI